mmetsp:Transcript_32761/g.64542  ORF Transcript_32761/g.64542 Transcript_32761/m.64542 type:complete len:218 (+) Transcript_32761:887-1540(+)
MPPLCVLMRKGLPQTALFVKSVFLAPALSDKSCFVIDESSPSVAKGCFFAKVATFGTQPALRALGVCLTVSSLRHCMPEETFLGLLGPPPPPLIVFGGPATETTLARAADQWRSSSAFSTCTPIRLPLPKFRMKPPKTISIPRMFSRMMRSSGRLPLTTGSTPVHISIRSWKRAQYLLAILPLTCNPRMPWQCGCSSGLVIHSSTLLPALSCENVAA